MIIVIWVLFHIVGSCLKLAHVSSESHAELNSSSVRVKSLSRITASGTGEVLFPPPRAVSSDDDLRNKKQVLLSIGRRYD